ncbi:MAG: hypothetical protein ACHQHO_11705 [Solirubrobacterales bacterium]
MRFAGRTLGGERGEGLITGLILLAGVLVPLMFIVPLFGRIETAHLAVQQAARDAVRSATLAPNDSQAQAAAQNAASLAHTQTGIPLHLTLTGRFSRGSVLTASANASIKLGTFPGLGAFGTIAVQGHASAPVDAYRSLLPGGEP